MSSERPNPTADLFEGLTKGILSWTEEKIKEAVRRFNNREYTFVSDVEVVVTAKELLKTSEMSLFKQYVDDRDLRILFSLGLTLRKCERHKERVQSLRNNIVSKYGHKGLHIAQLVQNGFFNRYLASALERTRSSEELKSEIKNFLDNIEDHVHFAQDDDNIDTTAQTLIIKILAKSPKTFVICSSGFARDKFHEIVDIVKKWVRTGTLKYEYELYVSRYSEIFFLNKLEV